MPTEDHASREGSPTAPSPRGRKWLALVGSLLVTLVVLEGGFRLLGYGADRGPCFQGYVGAGIRLMCYDRNLNDYLDVDLTDPRVRRRFYDEYGVIDMEETYHYTPYGVVTPCDRREMRPGQLRPKPKGKIRLIAVGDSFTYGHGLKPGDPWPRQLESLLNEDGRDRFEVLNCGIGDTGVAETTRLVLETLLPLEPDALIYGWYLNDPIPSPSYAEAQQEWMSRSRDEARHIPDRYVSVGWEKITGARRYCAIYDFVREKLNQRYLGWKSIEWINGMYGAENEEGWSHSQELLGLVAKALRERGAEVHVAVWPMMIGFGPDYPLEPAHRAIAEVCSKLKIPCLDLRETLATEGDVNKLILHPEDRHPSRLASRLAAEAIQGHLRTHHPDWFR